MTWLLVKIEITGWHVRLFPNSRFRAYVTPVLAQSQEFGNNPMCHPVVNGDASAWMNVAKLIETEFVTNRRIPQFNDHASFRTELRSRERAFVHNRSLHFQVSANLESDPRFRELLKMSHITQVGGWWIMRKRFLEVWTNLLSKYCSITVTEKWFRVLRELHDQQMALTHSTQYLSLLNYMWW